jgi:hypothetical protein
MKIDPVLLQMLRAAGETYDLVHRKRHVQLYVRGQAVLTLPRERGDVASRQQKNARAALLKFLRSSSVQEGAGGATGEAGGRLT